jgi:hypothetical protein
LVNVTIFTPTSRPSAFMSSIDVFMERIGTYTYN